MKRALLSVLISGALFGCGSETTGPVTTPPPEPIPPADTAPVASNLQITGDPMIGNSLTLSYDFTDAEGHVEADSIISWFMDDGNSVTPISSGTQDTLVLTGAAGQVGEIYATVKPVAAEGTDKDLGVTVFSSKVKTYPNGSAPIVADIEIIAPEALGLGVPLTVFYDYSDADGDVEHADGALITWVDRNNGAVLGNGKTLSLPAGYTGMAIGVDVVARSVDYEEGARGKLQADPVVVADLAGVMISEPYVMQIDTANSGWGEGVFLVKNIRNQLLLVKSGYDRASNDQFRLASLDVYKLSDDADKYAYEDGFLKSNDPAFDHITFSLGINGYSAPASLSVPSSDYYSVKIGTVPYNGANGGNVETFVKPTDAKHWVQGATLYDDGSVLLDQDVFFNRDNVPKIWSGPNALTLDVNITKHLNDVDANSPARSWYNSIIAFEDGVADATVVKGSMESGLHEDTTTMTLAALVSNGVNTDAHNIGSPIVTMMGYEGTVFGNSTVSSDVRQNMIIALQDGTYWSSDSVLMDYFNDRISVKWPSFAADSTEVLSLGIGSDSPMLLTKEGLSGSYIYSEDSFSGDPLDVSRYKLPFELSDVEFTVTCTNTNSLYPPEAQGEHHNGGDVNLQGPDTTAGTVPVVPANGGSGALIARNPTSKQMWLIDTDYASAGVTLSYSEAGVSEVRAATHFEACDSVHGVQPMVVVKNETTEQVSVLTTESLSQSYGSDPRLAGNVLTVKVASGAEEVTGTLASASLVSKLTSEGILNSTIEDVNVWVREDDGDTYVRVSDMASGKMVFQDSAGASLGGTYMIDGVSKLMTDADSGLVAKNQEGFVVGNNGMVFSSFADTLRIGGVTNAQSFEDKLEQVYLAINNNPSAFGDVINLNFDYASSSYPLPVAAQK